MLRLLLSQEVPFRLRLAVPAGAIATEAAFLGEVDLRGLLYGDDVDAPAGDLRGDALVYLKCVSDSQLFKLFSGTSTKHVWTRSQLPAPTLDSPKPVDRRSVRCHTNQIDKN
jgi:hypothetical protein